MNKIAIVALAGLVSAASGQVIYSGELNLLVPSTFDGLEVDMITGDFSTDFTTTDSDFNLYAGTTSWANYSRDGAGTTVVDAFGAATTLAAGETIGSGSLFGATASAFFGTFDVEGYIGVNFVNEATGETHYGWALVDLNETGDSFLVSYAYEATAGASIAAGAIPAPGAAALLGLGGLVAARRRR